MLNNKVILLGVTGSIAAYKAIYLTRLLTEAGAEVLPVLTKSACRFVGPLSFSALTGNRAVTDLWSSAQAGEIGHVEWAHRADILVIAPASANTLAKVALGLADDPLSAIALSTQAPILVAPAMEDGMWKNPATRAHIETLTNSGVMIASPTSGALASRRVGQGRMAEPEVLFESICSTLSPTDLVGKNILVTAGPTQEPLDPVRFLTNHSSGKMGYAIARRAAARGASVQLISGPTHLPVPPGVEITFIQTTQQLLNACEAHLPTSDTFIMAAAPSDYRPRNMSEQKLKKTGANQTLELDSNPDILMSLQTNRSHCFTVGFAAESENLLSNAKDKLQRKGLSLIVANDITADNAGFGVDTNTVTFILPNGETKNLPNLPKLDVADRLLTEILLQSEP